MTHQTFYQVRWNELTVKGYAYIDRGTVEIDSLTFYDENGHELTTLEILLSLTPSKGSTVKEPIQELSDLILTEEAETLEEKRNGTYYSSCD
jgi:hypothetical protein